jgi:hypothetical protein
MYFRGLSTWLYSLFPFSPWCVKSWDVPQPTLAFAIPKDCLFAFLILRALRIESGARFDSPYGPGVTSRLRGPFFRGRYRPMEEGRTEASRTAHQLFYDAFVASPIGIAAEDFEGRPLFVNQAPEQGWYFGAKESGRIPELSRSGSGCAHSLSVAYALPRSCHPSWHLSILNSGKFPRTCQS